MTSLLAVVLSIARISLGHSFAVVPQRKAVATGSMVLFDSAVEEGKNTEPDLFDYFDPLMSPHAYPNGVSPNHKPVDPKKETKETMKGPDPVKMPPVTESFLSEPFETSSEEPISLSNVRFDNMAKSPYQKGAVVDPDYFDPTLSPHSYPNGAPNRMVGEGESTPKQERVVGVLLMDHGSRNQPSNDRLQELAKIYEQSVGGPIVVRAAHMEIAKPSIPDGLQTLIDEGVDEIICHPFFLSAAGRHVSEDIPAILEEAISTMNIEIPVTTTDPVGSQTDVMIRAIHTLVQEKARINYS